MPSDRALALAAQWNTEAAAIVGGETIPAGHRHSQSDIDDLVTAINGRIASSTVGAANGVAPLDASAKVPVANLPDISTTRGVFPVTSQAAMLALNAQVGAVAVRSDLNGQSYILAALPASNLSNWLSQSPPGTVTSVNGQTGAVTVTVPVTSVNGLTGEVVIPAATTSVNGLLSAADKTKLDAIDQTAIGRVVWTARSSNATISPNENTWANSGVTQLTLPTSPSGSHEIINNTAGLIDLVRGGTATLSGVSAISGLTFSGQTLVRIRPGSRVAVIASGSNWIVQNATNPTALNYGGSPPATGAAPPLTGLFYHLGTNLGTGAWSNPAGGSLLTVAASGIEVGAAANATDRTNNYSYTPNTANSWIGWEVPRTFTPIGFLFQTSNNGTGYPRSFEIRGTSDVGVSFSSSTAVASWTQIQSWSNQTQITGNFAWFYFPITNAVLCRRFAFRMTGASSSGLNHLEFSEFEFFGFFD